MAQKRLKSMIFPGLSDTYTVPQALSDLTDYSDFTDAQQDIVDLQTGLTAAEESVTTYVVGNTNTTGVQLDPGTYVWVKNHSVLTDGLYTVGSTAIVQGGSVVDTNMNAVSEGGLNDLKNTFNTALIGEDISSHVTLSNGGSVNKAIKIGNLVIIHITTPKITSANTEATIATVDSGYRPKNGVIYSGAIYPSTASDFGYGAIGANSSGYIIVYYSKTTTYGLQGTIVYYIN